MLSLYTTALSGADYGTTVVQVRAYPPNAGLPGGGQVCIHVYPLSEESAEYELSQYEIALVAYKRSGAEYAALQAVARKVVETCRAVPGTQWPIIFALDDPAGEGEDFISMTGLVGYVGG